MTVLDADKKTDVYRIYESIWRNMDREHNLINQRIGWCIFFSAGLFSASTVLTTILLTFGRGEGGIQLTALLADNLHLVRAAISFMLMLLAGAGAIFAWETRKSVTAARDQIAYLRTQFEHAERRELFRRLDLPRPFGEKLDAQDRGRAVAVRLPTLLTWIWAVLSICDLLMTILFVLSPRLI